MKGHLRIQSVLVLFLLWGTSAAHGEGRLIPDSESDFPAQDHREKSFFVEGSRVAWANYRGIRRRFSQTRHLTDAQIRDWVIHNFAYVSESQAELDGIRQSTIPFDRNRSRDSIRQAGWERAGHLEADGGGTADVKGNGLHSHSSFVAAIIAAFTAITTGRADLVPKLLRARLDLHAAPMTVDSLRTLDHSDGLMSFGEALAELARERAVHYLLQEKKPPGHSHDTVESLFVIELPFDILKDGGKRVRAALYGREGHLGRVHGVDPPNELYTDPMGKGQTSGVDGRKVDFGAVLIQDTRLLANFGHQIGEFDTENAQKTKVWAAAHQAAERFRDTGDLEVIRGYLDHLLGPIQSVIDAAPSTLAEKEFASPHALAVPYAPQAWAMNEILAAGDDLVFSEHQRTAVHWLIRRLRALPIAEVKNAFAASRQSRSFVREALAKDLIRRGEDFDKVIAEVARAGRQADHDVAARIAQETVAAYPLGELPDSMLSRLTDNFALELLATPARRGYDGNSRHLNEELHASHRLRALALKELFARNTDASRKRASTLLSIRYFSLDAIAEALAPTFQETMGPWIKTVVGREFKSLSDALSHLDPKQKAQLLEAATHQGTWWAPFVPFFLSHDAFHFDLAKNAMRTLAGGDSLSRALFDLLLLDPFSRVRDFAKEVKEEARTKLHGTPLANQKPCGPDGAFEKIVSH